MHYTGTIWRPPYEAGSLLLEVTAGCTYHKCKFCTLYDELPFQFRMAPLEQVESDLREVQMLVNGPMERLADRLQALPARPVIRRVYLVGANPFVLRFERLKAIAELIGTYLPTCRTIGCFARVTDVALKTDRELQELHRLGYDGLSIGVETGDDEALAFMNKGYQAKEIVEQTHRLDQAGISYHFMYLTGLAGAGKGAGSALKSAEVFNQTHPRIIGTSMLTVYPTSRLYQDILAGDWTEAGELEKLKELRTLLANLRIPVYFATLGASNAVWVEGRLPEDQEAMLEKLTEACDPANEKRLRRYREQLDHL